MPLVSVRLSTLTRRKPPKSKTQNKTNAHALSLKTAKYFTMSMFAAAVVSAVAVAVAEVVASFTIRSCRCRCRCHKMKK